MKKDLAIFEGHEIRRIYDEKTETWFFSVVDIIQVLTQQPDFQTARKYWNKLKERLGKEGSQLVTNCHRFKLPADDGKMRLTDVANAETLLRLVQSVPSPKAEPIKLWLAKVGYERMQEMSDPARALERARATWQKHGRSDKWRGRVGVLARRAGHPAQHMRTSRATPRQETFGVSRRMRDTAGETPTLPSTRQIAETTAATGMAENKTAAKTGGKIAKRARLELESQTGQRIVTGENYLPPGSVKKIR